MTDQNAMPGDILPILQRHNIPQGTLAFLTGITQPQLSLWLSHKKGLSLNAQAALFRAVRFIRWIASQTELPVDFSNVGALKPHWQRFLGLGVESDLIRLNSETAPPAA